MRIFRKPLITILLFSSLVSCSLFQKEDNQDKDAISALLLSLWAYNQAAGCSGPKSGFTICIPKGIAD
ncbi:hypothetical protein CH354_00425 [Leptospira levettii]|uniref:hypothetical protein n=1 Tax=Leptospira levettii TaxID=2023178 RepID=UPI000C29EB88|nr:hypothetical protein [Leptospira levettii]MCW7473354.1 hypothetical protein [Leptospira levettii]PJZ37769.1 hypothetical protein CH354_00425 [Leptospira levettii]PJZ88974.1 hypothetical protein CH368_08865 [Leptospira levettii]PKA01479.1 hypothetical protein CH369_06895 [Leptospira levettii]